MRKITSKHVHDKRRRRNNIILGGILIGLMFFSTLGYAFQGFLGDTNTSGDQNVFEFNGFQFTEQNGFLVLDYYGDNLIFRYSPEEINGLELDFNSADYSGKKVYIYSEHVIAESEIKTNLINIAESVENACPENGNCVGFPVKTCEDNFIIIKISEENKITTDRNCIFIEGKEGDLTEISDIFLYKTLGVI